MKEKTKEWLMFTAFILVLSGILYGAWIQPNPKHIREKREQANVDARKQAHLENLPEANYIMELGDYRRNIVIDTLRNLELTQHSMDTQVQEGETKSFQVVQRAVPFKVTAKKAEGKLYLHVEELLRKP